MALSMLTLGYTILDYIRKRGDTEKESMLSFFNELLSN